MGLLKLNSLVVAMLAAAFSYFFIFVKHEPVLASILPFANDPYDAVGSFGVIAAVLLSLLAMARSFTARRQDAAPAQVARVARTQAAAALSTLIPLAADWVAMVRHGRLWEGNPAAGGLFLLMAGMTGLSLSVLAFLFFFSPDPDLPVKPGLQVTGGIGALAFLLVFALYPEGAVRSARGELLTLAISIVLFFALLALLTEAMMPWEAGEDTQTRRSVSRRWAGWSMAAALGVCIGILFLLGESREGGAGAMMHEAHFLKLASVFVGATTFGLLSGYAFLRKPLGL